MAETETARVVGIDLGTTNSLVAFMQGDQPQVIPGDDGSKLVPSVVAIPAAGKGTCPCRQSSALASAEHAGSRGLLREAPDGPRR